MICLLPQLRVSNRYTEDWIQVWEREFTSMGVDYVVVEPISDVRPKTKYFTNPIEAVTNECLQICNVLQRFDYQYLLCLDADFPGLLAAVIPVLKLVRKEVRCFGYLHAGSWCNGDIFGTNRGKMKLEWATLEVLDRIFVATNYHKDKIIKYFLSYGFNDTKIFNKILVVGFPFYAEDVRSRAPAVSFSEKSSILFTGRSEQSDYSQIYSIRRKYGGEFLHGVRCRDEYFEKVSQAKIVISLKMEETFGLIPLEAYALGGIPLCPRSYAYREVLEDNSELLYEGLWDLETKLGCLLEYETNPFDIDITRYEYTIRNIVDCILNV